MSEPNHAFWRKLILPEEERDLLWDGKGYRWFRSPNVVPIEQWRRERTRPENGGTMPPNPAKRAPRCGEK